MLCWRGRELDTITQVEVIDHFRAVREDLPSLAQAMMMLEVIDQVAVEGHAMPGLFRMLAGALRTLAETPSQFLAGAFLWKLLAIEGVGPSIDTCAGCGEEKPLVAFDLGEHGFLCAGCRRGQAVSGDTVELVRRVLSGDLAGALAEPPSAASIEAERLAILAVEHHIDRRLRSPKSLAEMREAAEG
jgi:DNA repair protein RecO (recombination protein O)